MNKGMSFLIVGVALLQGINGFAGRLNDKRPLPGQRCRNRNCQPKGAASVFIPTQHSELGRFLLQHPTVTQEQQKWAIALAHKTGNQQTVEAFLNSINKKPVVEAASAPQRAGQHERTEETRPSAPKMSAEELAEIGKAQAAALREWVADSEGNAQETGTAQAGPSDKPVAGVVPAATVAKAKRTCRPAAAVTKAAAVKSAAASQQPANTPKGDISLTVNPDSSDNDNVPKTSEGESMARAFANAVLKGAGKVVSLTTGAISGSRSAITGAASGSWNWLRNWFQRSS